MLCSRCGNPLGQSPSGDWCLRCSFERALASDGPEGSGADSGLGGYDLLQKLGMGSMGVVWLARERALDRLVALKIPAEGSDPQWSARLVREGKAAARLHHPNIVAVYSLGGAEGSAFLAMQVAEGGGLDERLRGELPSPREAAEIARKIAGALAYAHEQGVLHRDVKPSNILLGEKGEPMLADFGLAAPIVGAGDLTLPGHILGTPAYLAPELLGGSDKAGPASDVYGLGAVLYTCLVGRAPFVGESAAAILAQLAVADIPPPANLRPGIPKDLATICMKCLEKAPERRYPSARALEDDLRAFLAGKPIAARPAGPIERLARVYRRSPALATSITATLVCVLALAIGGPVMAYRLAQAQAVAVERLRQAILEKGRALRIAARIGQRDDALAAATEAARMRPGPDARDDVIAALARPEVVLLRRWPTSACADAVIAGDPDHDRYLFEASPGRLQLRRLSDNSVIQNLEGGGAKIWSTPVFSGDGRLVAARDANGSVLVWRDDRPRAALEFRNRPYVLTGRFTGYGRPDAFSPDGAVLASALPGGGVSLAATADGRELARIPTESEATHVAYSADGRFIAIVRGLGRGGRQGAPFVRIIDSASLRDVSRPVTGGTIQSIAWRPDEPQIVISGQKLDVFDAASGILVRSLNDPLATRAMFGPGGSTLLGVSPGGELTLWDIGASRPLLTGSVGTEDYVASGGGGEVLFTGDPDGVRLFRIEMPAVARTWPPNDTGGRENVLSAAVSTVDFSPDGSRLATAIWGAVQLRDGTGRLVDAAALGSRSNYTSVRFAPDGSSLIAGTAEDGLVRLPIVAGPRGPLLGKPVPVDPGAPEFVADVSRDGSRVLVTSLLAGFAKVVALDGPGRVRWELPGAAGAAFVDGGDVLASCLAGGQAGRLAIRSSADGSVVRELPYPPGAHVNLSPDGSFVVVGTGKDGTAILRTRDWSRGAPLPREVQGMDNPCAVAPDSRTLAFGVGPVVWLVDARDGTVLARLQGCQGGTYLAGLEFSPDGGRLALWWQTGHLTLWDLGLLRSELRNRKLDW